MSVSPSLYHVVHCEIAACGRAVGLTAPSITRLALLVVGVLAAETCVVRRVAGALHSLGLTTASQLDSLERRIRRTLNDPQLATAACYEAAVRRVLRWTASAPGTRIVLAIDESSQADRLHLLRISLPYWGGALPLAWTLWPQNTPQAAGHYWAQIDAGLDRLAALLPPQADVVLLGDRYYDIPPFVDRVAARGWHWLLRLKANSSIRFRDAHGREQALRALLVQHVPGPGRQWWARGQVFKRAGWRDASVLAVWAHGCAAPLVVVTDLPPRPATLAWYDRRFWIEPGFRTDKTHGWQWEASQVRDADHQAHLLLALAWATLCTLCWGQQAAATQLQTLQLRPLRPRGGRLPRRLEPPRDSLFSLGLRAVRTALYRATAPSRAWHLPDPLAPSWSATWRRALAFRYLFSPVRP